MTVFFFFNTVQHVIDSEPDRHRSQFYRCFVDGGSGSTGGQIQLLEHCAANTSSPERPADTNPSRGGDAETVD